MSIDLLKAIPEDSIKTFETYEALYEWATNSTFGGGRLIKLAGKTAVYFIADRMYTSGMITSETSVYTTHLGKYCLVYYLPLKYLARSYKIDDGKLIVSERPSEGKESKLVIDEKKLGANALYLDSQDS
jgi:hypothetical protein